MSEKDPPAFQFYPKDFLTDTMAMPAETRGIYITLLCYQWINGSIPESAHAVARICSLTTDEITGHLTHLDGKFVDNPEHKGTRVNPRMERERQKQSAFRKAKRKAGIASGKARSNKTLTKSNPSSSSSSSSSPSDNHKSPSATGRQHPFGDTPGDEKKGKPTGRFEEFWEAYPKKVGKKPCVVKWKARRLDRLADQIIENVRDRIKGDDQWLRGYVPNPLTFINQDRWDDPIQKETAGEKTQRGRQETFDEIHERNREKAGLD